jgi:hypothetical protein
MKNYLLVAFLLIKVPCLFSQAIPPVLRSTMTLGRVNSLNTTGNAIPGIPLPPGKLIGDSYLDTKWKVGVILFYETKPLIEGYPIRYDIELNQLEINTSNGIKVLSGNTIRSFTWIDSLSQTPAFFSNAKDYSNEAGTPLVGFFEVLSDGAIPAFKSTHITIKKANYVKEFDTGTRDDEILKKEEFLYAKGQKAYSIPTSKKKLLPIFGAQSEKVDSFIQLNNMSLRESHHIKAIFEYYNSLEKK